MIGIGSASRRGIWMHNGNAAISLLRNVLTMFSSHRINNATNFEIAARNVADSNLSVDDRSKAARYMMSITAQTVAFSATRAGILLMMGSAIMSAVRSEDDDELEELYKRNRSTMSVKEKELLDQEIATRKQIRSAIGNFDRRNSSARLLALNTGKELISNIWLGTAFVDFPSDFLFHLTFDEYEKNHFNSFKEGELERLKILKEQAQKTNNKGAYAQVSTAISDLESQEAMLVVFENHSVLNMGGIVGPFLKANYDIASSARDAVFTDEEWGLQEMSLLLGTYGMGSPDMDRYLKLREKVIKARVEGEENKKKAIEKLYKDHKIPTP
jgi:hypothetical protein